MNKKDSVLTYDDYVKGIRKLEPGQQLSLVELLSAELKKSITPKGINPKITALKGLGADIWKDVDTDEFLKKERASWD